MTTERVRTGNTEPIEVYVTNRRSEPLTGLTSIYVRIRRVSDGYYLDWNDDTFKNTGWTTLNQICTQVDATNFPGLYNVTGGWDTSAITNETPDDDYQVLTLESPVDEAVVPAPATIRLGQWVDQIDEIWDKLPTNYIMGSSVQSDKDDELDAILADTAAIQPLVDVAVSSRESEASAASRAATNQGEHDTTQAAITALNNPTPANIADAVWDEVAADHVAAGSVGQLQNYLDAFISTRAAPGVAMNLVTDAVNAGSLSSTAVAELADGIWDELIAGHLAAGTTGKALVDGAAAGSPDPVPIAQAVWDRQASAHVAAGSMGELQNNCDVDISTRAVPGDAMDLVAAAVDSTSLDVTAVAEIVDGVWDEALSGHVVAGSTGEALGRVDVVVSSRAVPGDAMDLVADAVDASAVATSGAEEISDVVWDELLSGHTIVGSAGEAQARLDAAVSSRAAPGNQMALTAVAEGALVDATWDEPTAGHTAAGSTGKALTDASATTSPATIAAAVWDASTVSHVLPGSMGLYQGRLDQPISTRAAPGDLMGLQNDALTAAALATSAAHEIRDAILSDSTPFQGARIDAAISSRAVAGDAMDLVTDAVDSGSLASSAVDEIVDQTWREAVADHSGVAGSTAEELTNAATSVSPGAIADAVWDELLSGHTVGGSAGEALGRVDVTVSSRAAPGASMDLVTNAVDAAALAADAVTEIQTAILSDATPFAGGNLDAAVSSRAVAGDDMGLTAGAVDLILDEALSGHTTLGTVGKALNNVDAQVSTRAAPGDDMGVTAGGVADVADGVWDEPLAGHVSSGSAGRKLNDLTVPPTVGDVADAVWDEALAGHAGAGSAGEAQARLDAAVTTRAAPGDDMGLISAAILAAADQVWEENLAAHSGTGGSTAEALARTEAAQVAAAVWDAALASYDTGGTFGGAINACCATAAGASQVTINIQDLSSNPVQGAQVDFYDATNTTFLTRHFTDINGQVVVAIDDGTYAVRIWASGYAFTVPETLVVSGDGSATFQGQSFLSPTAPSGPDKCVIYGQVLDAGGAPVVGAEVDANAVTPQAGGGYIIGPQIASTITDAAGYFELELLRNIEVNFVIDDADINVIKTVPDAPNQWYTSWA